MSSEPIETRAHTTGDGMLHLSVQVGMPDTDVAVIMHVQAIDANGASKTDAWPEGYFESVVGSMPDIARPQVGEQFDNSPHPDDIKRTVD